MSGAAAGPASAKALRPAGFRFVRDDATERQERKAAHAAAPVPLPTPAPSFPVPNTGAATAAAAAVGPTPSRQTYFHFSAAAGTTAPAAASAVAAATASSAGGVAPPPPQSTREADLMAEFAGPSGFKAAAAPPPSPFPASALSSAAAAHPSPPRSTFSTSHSAGGNMYGANLMSATLRVGFTVAADGNALDWLQRTTVKPVRFGLPFVDPHLTGTIAPDAAAPTASPTPTASPGSLGIASVYSAYASHGLRARDVMEIVGPSGVGKTELLYAAALQTALPQAYEGMPLGGGNGSVLFVDLDTRFSLPRFVALLQARLRLAFDATPNRSPTETIEQYFKSPAYHALYRTVLNRVFVVTAETPLQFVAVLHSVPKLATHCARAAPTSATASSNSENEDAAKGAGPQLPIAPLSLLLIDNIGAYYWQKRALVTPSAPPPPPQQSQQFQRPGGRPVGGGGAYHAMTHFYEQVTRMIRSVTVAHNLVAIVSKPTFFKNALFTDKDGVGVLHRDYLPRSWTALVNSCRIIVQPTHEHNRFHGQITLPPAPSRPVCPIGFLFESTADGLIAFVPVNRAAEAAAKKHAAAAAAAAAGSALQLAVHNAAQIPATPLLKRPANAAEPRRARANNEAD